MITSFEGLIQAAVASGPKRVAVAAANNRESINAVIEAKLKGVAEPVLIGDEPSMAFELKAMGYGIDDFEVIDEVNPVKSADRAVALVASGAADILMKGNISTAKFMQSALSSRSGLRLGRLVSDIFVFEDTRGGQPRLMMGTDGGINIKPGIKEKIVIIQNAVALAHKLGFHRPRVALLSASEKVHPDLQSTIDAVAIVKICQDMEMPECIVDGPFALDNVVDTASAREKGIESPVAGSADILMVPNMEAGNILGKCLQYFAGKKLAHVALGAKAPILIPSRTASTQARLTSIAMAALTCTDL